MQTGRLVRHAEEQPEGQAALGKVSPLPHGPHVGPGTDSRATSTHCWTEMSKK